MRRRDFKHLIFLALWFGLAPMLSMLLRWRSLIPGRDYSHLIAGILMPMTLVPAFWYFHRAITHNLRVQLNQLGMPTCMHCGYDLRACTDDRCSECGLHFQKKL